MSCCPPSITPDYSGDSGGGGSSGVQTVTAGTNVSITGSGTNPIINAFPGTVVVSSIEGLSGAVNLIGNNITITTSGQDITLSATGSGYPNITAGVGISVTGTAADPVITNLNPSPSYPAISAGSGITVGGTASAPVITNTNPTPVYPAISAGAGISVTGTAAAPIITNTASSGYPNITGGAGITVGGTAAAPIITNTNPTLISLSAGSGISINNSNPLVPIITNTASSGYPNISAGAGISVTGTAAAPIITNLNPSPSYPAISAGAGISVNNTNPAAPIITNTNPTLITINPGVGIAVDNTNPLAPIISNNNATPFTLNSQAGAVTLQNNDTFISVNAALNIVNIDIPEIVTKLNNIYNKPVNIITNTLTIVDDIPAGTITIDGAGIIPVPLYTIYVSPLGNDLTGTGSVQQPFLTIQKAINHRQTTNPENVITEILIYSGVYSEDLTITMGNTIFSGYSSVQYDTPQVKINGSTPVSSFINIDLAIDEGIVLVGFVNITMNESTIEKTITATTASLSGNYNLAFNNCNIRGSITATSGVFLQQSNLTITNCRIKSDNGSSPLITNNGCLLNIFQSQLEHTAAVTVPVVLMEANASYQGVINCQYSKITSSTNNSAPFPIIKYILSIQNTFIENILYNTISYTSALPDTSNNKCCIQYNLTAAIFLFVGNMVGNTFLCEGVSVNSECIQTIGSLGQVNIGYFGNNYAINLANKVAVTLTSIGSVLVPVTQ